MSTTSTIDTVPVGNHNNGTHTTPTRAIPVGFDSATVQINCTTGTPATPFTGFAHPFSSAAMSITFGIHWSWDGGATFPESTQKTQTGESTGIWGYERVRAPGGGFTQGAPIMTPEVQLGLPDIGTPTGPPTTYRAYMTVAGGPITFGLTVLETTG